MSEEKIPESLKFYTSIIKWFLGTFCISLITIVTNYQIYKTQLELKKQEQDREYIGRFIQQALDIDVDSRLRFSHYFSCLSPELGWDKYYQDTLQEQKIKLLALKSLDQQIASVSTQITQNVPVVVPNPRRDVQTPLATVAVELIEKKQELVQAAVQLRQDLSSRNPLVQKTVQNFLDKNKGWIYLGKVDRTASISPVFKPATILSATGSYPVENSTCVVSTATYLRTGFPTDDYQLAESLRILPIGQSVKINKLQVHEGRGSLWAEVQVIY